MFITELTRGQRFYLNPKAKAIGSYLTFHECKDFDPRAIEVLLFCEEGMTAEDLTNFRIVVHRSLEVEIIEEDHDDMSTDELIILLDAMRKNDDWEAVRDLAVLLMIRKGKEK